MTQCKVCGSPHVGWIAGFGYKCHECGELYEVEPVTTVRIKPREPSLEPTTGALIAALRDRLKPLKSGDRLDLFDSLQAGYCVQCGDEMKDFCECEGEYREMDDPAYDKNNPAY